MFTKTVLFWDSLLPLTVTSLLLCPEFVCRLWQRLLRWKIHQRLSQVRDFAIFHLYLLPLHPPLSSSPSSSFLFTSSPSSSSSSFSFFLLLKPATCLIKIEVECFFLCLFLESQSLSLLSLRPDFQGQFSQSDFYRQFSGQQIFLSSWWNPGYWVSKVELLEKMSTLSCCYPDLVNSPAGACLLSLLKLLQEEAMTGWFHPVPWVTSNFARLLSFSGSFHEVVLNLQTKAKGKQWSKLLWDCLIKPQPARSFLLIAMNTSEFYNDVTT